VTEMEKLSKFVFLHIFA